MLNAISQSLVSVVFPLCCELCGAALPLRRSSAICDGCEGLLAPIPAPFCDKCGRHAPAGCCLRCENERFHFDQVFASCAYDPNLKKLLCAFKFRRRLPLRRTLRELLERCLLERCPGFPWDAVAAVPMQTALRLERGFNQAEILASDVARFIEKPFLNNALAVRGPARQQARLGKKERKENVRGLFFARPAVGKRFLLVDDILTTGQTASECAHALKQAGAASVDVLVVARGL